MIKTKDEGIVVFHNTHDAIKADNICMSAGIKAGLISVHPSISLGCGFMLKIEWKDFSNLIKTLDDENINYKALYYSQKRGMKREVELLYEDKEDITTEK